MLLIVMFLCGGKTESVMLRFFAFAFFISAVVGVIIFEKNVRLFNW